MTSLRGFVAVAVAAVVGVGLVGCGPSAEDTRREQVAAMCSEADEVMSEVTLDEIVPLPSADWTSIQSFYADIESRLQELSKEASDLGEDQLARDFSSVGKDAGSLEAVASLISLVGYGMVVAEEWLTAVNTFSGNEALRSPSDRSFIGC